MDDLAIDARKQELLEARFLGPTKGQSGSESNMSTGSSVGPGANASSDKDTDSFPGYPSTPDGCEKQDLKRSRKRKGESYDASRKGSSSTSAKKINEYFEPASPARSAYIHSDRQMISPPFLNPIRSSPSSRHSNSSNHIDYSGLVHLQHKQYLAKETRLVQTELTSELISQLIEVTNGKQTEKNRKLDELQRTNTDLEYRLNNINEMAIKYEAQLARCLKVCQELLIEKARTEKAEARRKSMEGRLRLGQFTRQGTGYQESWSNGWAFAELGEKREKINREKEDIEKARKSLNKRKPTSAASRYKGNYSEEGSFLKPKVTNEPSYIH